MFPFILLGLFDSDVEGCFVPMWSVCPGVLICETELVGKAVVVGQKVFVGNIVVVGETVFAVGKTFVG